MKKYALKFIVFLFILIFILMLLPNFPAKTSILSILGAIFVTSVLGYFASDLYKLDLKKLKNRFQIINLIVILILLYFIIFITQYYASLLVFLIIPILWSKSSSRYLYVNAVIYLFLMMSSLLVPAFVYPKNPHVLEIISLFMLFAILSLIAAIGGLTQEERILRKSPKKTKLKYHKMKSGRGRFILYFLLGIAVGGLIIATFVLFLPSTSGGFVFNNLYDILIIYGIFGITAVVLVYETYKINGQTYDLIVNTKQIILKPIMLRSFEKEKTINFKDIDKAYIAKRAWFERDVFGDYKTYSGMSPYKQQFLRIEGKKALIDKKKKVQIKLADFSPEDVKKLKDMLHTYLGKRFSN